MLSEETKQKLILSLLGLSESDKEPQVTDFYKIGEDYVVRTVTMIYLGKLKSEASDHLILEDCAWIPDTSRWSEFLQGENPKEQEPYINDVIVYKGAILDATRINNRQKNELI